MWTSICCVLSVIVFFTVASESEVIDRNGWLPVSSDIVYRQIIQSATHSPRYTSTDDVQIVNTDAFNTVTTQGESDDVAENHINDNIKKYFDVQDDFSPNVFQLPENNSNKAETPVRRAKKLNKPHQIIDDGIFIAHSKYESKDNLIEPDRKKAESRSTDVISHKYEVTENVIVEDAPKYEENASERIGYVYQAPARRQNFTDLFKYLSKYNINDSDKLQNYDLSRRPYAEIPRKSNPLTKPFEFRVPISYNSLNHLPVDPLLAVFLSNYGYYLQGQYGIQNNYNNLYGYLASNNLHNNRPFGFYKLFSDTDSSH